MIKVSISIDTSYPLALETGIQENSAHRFYEVELDYDKWFHPFRKMFDLNRGNASSGQVAFSYATNGAGLRISSSKILSSTVLNKMSFSSIT